MISVEQVRALEERVEKAVGYISALKTENVALRHELEEAKSESVQAQARIAGLESAAEAFRRDQVSIEEGIIHALRKLDAFEDLVLKVGQPQGRPEGEPGSPAAAVPKAAMEALAPAAKSPKNPPKIADELSIEELEAATAPTPPAPAPAPPVQVAAPPAPPAPPAAPAMATLTVAEEPSQAPALEGELDIF